MSGSPILVDTAGERQFVTYSASNACGVSAATGKKLWGVGPGGAGMPCTTPVPFKDWIILADHQDSLRALRLERGDKGIVVSEVWKAKALPLYYSSPVVAGDLVFGMSTRNQGCFFCLDAGSGKTLWQSDGRQGGYASIVNLGSVLLVLKNRGQLLVVKPSATAFEPIAEYRVCERPTLAHPVFLGDRILIKDDRTLRSFRLVPDAGKDANEAKENKDFEKQIRNVTGSVKAVAAEKSTLTIANREGENTYTVAPDAEIWIDGKPAKLATLPPGPHVYATLSVDHKTVRSINALGRHFPFAAVKAVDAEKGAITFDDAKAPPEVAGKTFPVMKDPHVTIDGEPGKLAAVPPGAVISLYLCVDQKTVCAIDAGGPVFEGVHAAVVKAVNPAKNTITFDEDKSPPEVAGITFPLAKNASITIDSRPAKLAEIPTGAVVNLTLSVDQKTARLISTARP
jgi:hypothetical protein